jgi:hypothetical protein
MLQPVHEPFFTSTKTVLCMLTDTSVIYCATIFASNPRPMAGHRSRTCLNLPSLAILLSTPYNAALSYRPLGARRCDSSELIIEVQLSYWHLACLHPASCDNKSYMQLSSQQQDKN